MKKAVALALLVLASLAIVACGSSSSSTGSEAEPAETTSESGSAAGGGEAEGGSEAAGGGSTVKISTPTGTNLAFTTKSATAKAGPVTIDFNNPQELQHDVAIESSSGEVVGETELVAAGEASTSVNLKPGKYTFFCTVPGHREAGMEGTLTVK